MSINTNYGSFDQEIIASNKYYKLPLAADTPKEILRNYLKDEPFKCNNKIINQIFKTIIERPSGFLKLLGKDNENIRNDCDKDSKLSCVEICCCPVALGIAKIQKDIINLCAPTPPPSPQDMR